MDFTSLDMDGKVKQAIFHVLSFDPNKKNIIFVFTSLFNEETHLSFYVVSVARLLEVLCEKRKSSFYSHHNTTPYKQNHQ